MNMRVVVISFRNGQEGKYWIADFIDHIYLEIIMYIVRDVTTANVRVIYLLEMKYCKYILLLIKSLICGVLILCVIFGRYLVLNM